MNEYTVEITETLKRTITIKAYSDTDALLKVKEQYDNEEIVLSSEDYDGTEFEAYVKK